MSAIYILFMTQFVDTPVKPKVAKSRSHEILGVKFSIGSKLRSARDHLAGPLSLTSK